MKAMNIVGAVLFMLFSASAVAQDVPQDQNAEPSSAQAEQAPKRGWRDRLFNREAKAEEPKAETAEPTAQAEQPPRNWIGRRADAVKRNWNEAKASTRKAFHKDDKAGMEPVTVSGSAEAYAIVTRKGDDRKWQCASAMLPRGTQDGESMVNTAMFANCKPQEASMHFTGQAVDERVIFMVKGTVLIVLKGDTVLTCTASKEDQADAAKQPNTSYQREATEHDLAARGCKEMPKPRPAGRPVAQ